jgi:hypothetical protein
VNPPQWKTLEDALKKNSRTSTSAAAGEEQ